MSEAASHFRNFLIALGVDLSDPELEETPDRVSALYRHLLGGSTEPTLAQALTTETNNQVVIIKNVPFHSLCAHHLVPFFGHASVAYLPGGRVMGFGDFGHLLNDWARRPQLQERLGEAVLASTSAAIEPEAMIVVLRARQLCMELTDRDRGADETLTIHGYGLWEPAEVAGVKASELGLL